MAGAAEPQPPWFPGDPSCHVNTPPADAGAVVTPGGFMLVHPRNDRLAADYDGCKTLWIFDEAPDKPRRWATLLFAQGQLQRAVIWRRDASDIADRVCDRSGADPCTGIDDNELVALRLPSWPRVCMNDPGRKECREDPR